MVLLEDNKLLILAHQSVFQLDHKHSAELWTLLEIQLIKEDLLLQKRNIQFIEKHHHLMNKVQVLKFLSLVLKSLICLLHMQEVVKLVFLVVLESEKLSLFNNLLITSLKLTVVTLSLLVLVKEPEKVMICITKWFNQVSSRLMVQVQDVLWFMVKWTSLQELELELD